MKKRNEKISVNYRLRLGHVVTSKILLNFLATPPHTSFSRMTYWDRVPARTIIPNNCPPYAGISELMSGHPLILESLEEMKSYNPDMYEKVLQRMKDKEIEKKKKAFLDSDRDLPFLGRFPSI